MSNQTNWKQLEVVVLPIKPKDEFSNLKKFHTYNNVYLVSDEKINDGDWYINLQNPNKPYLNRSGNTKFDGLYENCKLIVATTDKNINDLLNIPHSFVFNFAYLLDYKMKIRTIGVLYENDKLDFVDSINGKFVITKDFRINYKLHELFNFIECFVMSTPQNLTATPERCKKINDWHIENFGFTLHEIIIDTHE